TGTVTPAHERNTKSQSLDLFPAPRQRLVSDPHGPTTERRQLGHYNDRKIDHGGLRTMKTTHLEEKQKLLLDRRERLIGRFDQAARARKNTARLCTEIRRTNDLLASLERI